MIKIFIISIFMFYSCTLVNMTQVKVEYILEGHSENISNDTLIIPDGYQLGELHLKLILYDYIAVDDSVHLFFQSLFASKCTNFTQLYTFENLENNKLKLYKKFILPKLPGIFKLVIPLQDTTINVAIKDNRNGYAFSSFKIKIE